MKRVLVLSEPELRWVSSFRHVLLKGAERGEDLPLATKRNLHLITTVLTLDQSGVKRCQRRAETLS
jgi:hypothetical protein